MSTDLYGIRILNVVPEEARVELRVFVVYYDVAYKYHQPLPVDHSFFLRILWDKGRSDLGVHYPIGDEISLDQFLDEQWIDRNTFRFIHEVKEISRKNDPLKSFKEYRDFYYEHNGGWIDEELLVQADYSITVTDSRYIEHLSKGMSWGTTAYQTEAFQLSMMNMFQLPDIGGTVIRLEPFLGEQEAGTPENLFFTPDSKRLIVINQEDEAVAFNTANFQERWRTPSKGYYCTDHSMVGDFLLFVEYNRIFQTIDINSGDLAIVERDVVAKTCASSGQFWYEFGDDNTLIIFNAAEEMIKKFSFDDTIEAVAMNHDESMMAVGGIGPICSFYRTDNWALIATIDTKDRINRIAFNHTGTLLAVLHAHTLEIYDVTTGEQYLNYKLPNGGYACGVSWSPDGRYCALINITGQSGYGGYVAVYSVGV